MNMIKYLRKISSMKQLELCGKLNISQATLSGWENGKFEPDIASLIQLSEIFGKSIDFILTGKENASQSEEQDSPLYILKDGEPPVITDKCCTPESDDSFFYAAFSDKIESCGNFEYDIYKLKKAKKISGRLPVVVRMENEYILSRSYKKTDGIILIPEPPKTPKFISNRDIEENKLCIIGEVVEKRKIYTQ